jgi:hypothetical protein
MVEASNNKDLNSSSAAFIFRDLPVGGKIKMSGGAIGEIVGNPGDGAWLIVRFTEHPAEPTRVGEEAMIFFMDVEEVV